MFEPVKVDYENECKRLQDVINYMKAEFQEEKEKLTRDLIKYEREIELLKAKLSTVELIFGK